MIVVLVVLVLYAASKGKKAPPPPHPVTFSPEIKRSALVPPRVTTEIDPYNGRFTPFS